jgi:hypothetical protein
MAFSGNAESSSAGSFEDGIEKPDNKLLFFSGKQPDLLDTPGQL